MKIGDLVRPSKPNDEIPSNVYRVSGVYEDRDMIYFTTIDGVFTHYLAPHQLEPLQKLFVSPTLQRIDAITDFAKQQKTETAYISSALDTFRLKTGRSVYRLVSDLHCHYVILWRSQS
jgi:hypothetical protein